MTPFVGKIGNKRIILNSILSVKKSKEQIKDNLVSADKE